MQTVNRHGVLGELLPLTSENLEKAMRDPNVDHVDVFEGTDENIAHRKKMQGKKFQVKKRFQKTGGNKKK